MPIDEKYLKEIPRMGNEMHAQDDDTRRKYAYDLCQQLNYLYDDIQAGLFGETAKTGKFVEYLLEVKAQFPKSNEPI